MNRISYKIIAIIFITQLLAACGGSLSLDGTSSGTSSGSSSDPTANAGDDQTVDELVVTTASIEATTVVFSGSGTDSDGTVDTFSWEQISGVYVAIDNAGARNASFSVPEVSETEVLVFELTITDNDGWTDTDSLQVTIIPHTTVANAGAAQTVLELNQVTLNPIVVRLSGSSSSDPEGSLASYQWEQVLATGDVEVTLTNDSTSAASFETPDVREDTELTFKLTVTDHAYDVDTDTVVITITDHTVLANAGVDQTAAELDADTLLPTVVTLDGASDSDIDGSVATFSWTQIDGPDVTLTDADTATPSFVVPEINNQEYFSFMLTVTERDTNRGNDTVIVTVNQHVAVANPGQDQTVEETTTVTLTGSSAADPGGDIATFQWEQLVEIGGISVDLTNADQKEATFVAPLVSENTDITFQLTTTDNEGDTGSATVVITVVELNSTAQAEAGIYQYVSEGDLVQLNGSFSKDLETSNVAFVWTQTDGLDTSFQVDLSSNSISEPSFTAPDVTAAVTLIFKLQVVDNNTDEEVAVDFVNIAVAPETPNVETDDDDGTGLLSYTKMDEYGAPLPANASEWSCVLDNNTGLVWEMKSNNPDADQLNYSEHEFGWYHPTIDYNYDEVFKCYEITNGSTCVDSGDSETSDDIGFEGSVIIFDPDFVIISSGNTATPLYDGDKAPADIDHTEIWDTAPFEAQCISLETCLATSPDTFDLLTVMNDIDRLVTPGVNVSKCRTRNSTYGVWRSSEWRIPTVSELESINDETQAATSPQLDPNYFPLMRNDAYWSSENDDVDPGLAKSWNFGEKTDHEESFMKINPDPVELQNIRTTLPVILVRSTRAN